MSARSINPPEPASDRDWFRQRPGRQYRLRPAVGGLVAVRRIAGHTFLRIKVAALPGGDLYDDPEVLAELAWWRAAYGSVMDRQTLQQAMRHTRREAAMTVADYCELIAIVAQHSPRWAVLNALDSIEELSRQAIRENPSAWHLRQQLARLRAARWRQGYAGEPRPREFGLGLYLRHAQSGQWDLAEPYSEFLAQTWNLAGTA